MHKEIQRKFYLDKIKKFVGLPLVKIITGQRRIGKSVLMEQLMQNFESEKVFYINKELQDWKHIYDDETLNELLETQIKNGKEYIFVDEVQKIKSRENTISSLLSKYKDKIDLFVTGSNSTILSKNLGTNLAGRYTQITVYPFDYYEFLEYIKEDTSKETFKKYIEAGTLPILYQIPKDSQKMRSKQLMDSIFIKEIYTKYKIDNTDILIDLFDFLVNNIGNINNISNIQKHLINQGRHINHTTLSNYINYLQDSYILYESSCYDIWGKKFFDRNKKYYISNPKMRIDQSSWKHNVLGIVLENIIFLHLIKEGRSVNTGKLKDKEIDFVAEKDNQKIYIQSAWLLNTESAQKRESENLLLIKDTWPKYIISMEDFEGKDENGIEYISAWNIKNIL